MFEQIIEFLPKLKGKPFGEWIIDQENDGTPEHPIQLPFVSYSQIVHEFEEAVYRFVDEHREMQLTDYAGILRKANVQTGLDSLKDADVSDYDGTTVMALIVGAIRAERFCDGALLGCFESGCIQKWLERLVEIDKAN
jgi:hypothetical protein